MSTMQSWFKKNTFVASATALPILVAVVFGLATKLPALYVDDPQYDFLLAIDSTFDNPTALDVAYYVDGGTLHATVSYLDSNPIYQVRELHRYNVQTGELKHIEAIIPTDLRDTVIAHADGSKRSTQAMVLSDALSHLTLIPNTAAPDGYVFRNKYGRGGGLFGELFGLRSRRYTVRLEHDGRVIAVPIPHNNSYHYYRDIQFLGWIDQ